MKYLTKSVFAHGINCPTKIYYSLNKNIYQSNLEENNFLKALADGGIQVGELAQCYYPNGKLIEYNTNKQISLNETIILLKLDDITLFEAAISYQNCYSLVDILVKKKNKIELIEVKSKSWEPTESFYQKRKSNYFHADWNKYFFDIAFQTWIARKAFPEYDIKSYLMLIDKSKHTTVSGLNQKFEIYKDENNRSKVRLSKPLEEYELGEQILTKIDVTSEVNSIFKGDVRLPMSQLEASGFDSWINQLSKLIRDNKKYLPEISDKCKNCEYRLQSELLRDNMFSGFNECWSSVLNWNQSDLKKPHIFDIWNEKSSRKMLKDELYFMSEVTPEYYNVDYNSLLSKKKLEYKDRKILQIMKSTGRDLESEFILPELFHEMDKWVYPLHFIDFEGIAPAIPLFKGMKPYQKTPFQFSVHTIYEDQTIEHSAEWIEKKRGNFPCFTFIRKLKKVLENDNGSVFMYHHYEKTTLNDVKKMLIQSDESDAKELVEFIDSLVDESSPRCLIDQQRALLDFYYSVFMGKSNSIKYVLPAVLNESKYLQDYYSKPYSGLSIKNKILYEKRNGVVANPYSILDSLDCSDIPEIMDEENIVFENSDKNNVSDGIMAMTAWMKMQFPEIEEIERNRVFDSLLRYCELDTLAMVMIYQHWMSLKKI